GFSYLLDRLGADGKPLFFLSVLVCEILTFTLLETLMRRSLAPPSPRVRERIPAVLGRIVLATVLYLIMTLVLILLTPAHLSSRTTWPHHILLASAVSTGYALVA